MISVLAKYFRHKPNSGCALTGGDRAKFLVLLSTTEPLTLTADKIPDQLYWQRCCNEQACFLCNYHFLPFTTWSEALLKPAKSKLNLPMGG